MLPLAYGAVELEITPEPPPDERAAVEAALAALLAGGGDGRTAWWREGIRENVLAEPDELPGS